MKRLLPLLLLLAACGEPTASADGARLEFRTRDGIEASELRIEGGTGEALASGVFTSGSSSARLAGELSHTGGELVLRVRLLSSGVLPMGDRVPWSARVTRLQPGLHHVRVLYDYTADGDGGSVWDVGEATVRVF